MIYQAMRLSLRQQHLLRIQVKIDMPTQAGQFVRSPSGRTERQRKVAAVSESGTCRRRW